MKKLSLSICLLVLAVPSAVKSITEEEAKNETINLTRDLKSQEPTYTQPIENNFRNSKNKALESLIDIEKKWLERDCLGNPTAMECQGLKVRFEETLNFLKMAEKIKNLRLSNIQDEIEINNPEKAKKLKELNHLLETQMQLELMKAAFKEKISVQVGEILKQHGKNQ